MKTTVVGLGCFLLAFVLGKMGPQSELRTLELQIEALKKELADRGRTRRAFDGITRMLHLPEGSAPPRPAPTPVEEPPSIQEPEPAARAVASGGDRRDADEDPQSGIEAGIDEAMDLWESRSKLARASFLTNLDADTAAAAHFDTVVAAMNLQVEDRITRWADDLAARGEASLEDGVRLMHEVTESIVFAYDQLDQRMPEDWREQAGEDFQLFDFIDPHVGLPLMQVEELMDDAEGRRRGSWRQRP